MRKLLLTTAFVAFTFVGNANAFVGSFANSLSTAGQSAKNNWNCSATNFVWPYHPNKTWDCLTRAFGPGKNPLGHPEFRIGLSRTCNEKGQMPRWNRVCMKYNQMLSMGMIQPATGPMQNPMMMRQQHMGMMRQGMNGYAAQQGMMGGGMGHMGMMQQPGMIGMQQGADMNGNGVPDHMEGGMHGQMGLQQGADMNGNGVPDHMEGAGMIGGGYGQQPGMGAMQGQMGGQHPLALEYSGEY